ncbi:GntR family transcriptional regulator [Jannaschia pagri]|uniref:GntR family transcriptional regulator n=1 Tax=Jannaschia pagri TaxID=2829797 RepID=A0ABQ4NHH0_9RHOB|nr:MULTISPECIES: GntR family transcriptional regulator [unclassified Jannaschia]GIT90011.1 GntR family transcriptional regulator [Jannaschia sp. AI_61]GIT93883.1 GntR family transcriptional regulator [Jannaschia sp. AI_62]
MAPDAPRPPRSRTAADVLRRLIFDGELAPGSDHLETELATRLGMSRTPIREAAVQLAAQGLVELRPRKGLRVLPISPEDMREIYEVLTELESGAAGRAAERSHAPGVLDELEAAISDMDAALDRDDRDAWADADDTFHRLLMRLGGNTRAEAVVAMLADQVRRARAVTLWSRPLPVQSNADHRAVLDAIRRGDAETARAIHRTHRETAGRMLLDLISRARLKAI